jgi:hypothetical protein
MARRHGKEALTFIRRFTEWPPASAAILVFATAVE